MFNLRAARVDIMHRRPALPLTLLLLILSLLLSRTARAHGHADVRAVYVFGDSTADVGNNNYLPGGVDSKANFLYNGIDYPGGVPTGRFCNGFIGVDFFAKKLGFAMSPPPVLSITSDAQEIKGLNFASGAGGILDSTAANVSLSMNEQVTLFEDHAARLKSCRGSLAARHHISGSVFVFSTGNNDLFTYYLSTGAADETLNCQYVSSLASQFKCQLKRLYDAGARKFAVFGLGLVGCPPVLRLLEPSGTGRCIDRLNDLAQRLNNLVQTALLELKLSSVGFEYSFVDTYAISTAIVQNSAAYGFTELNMACCGTGALRAQSACTVNATLCPNRRQFYNWDRFHPTQAVYKLIADFAYSGGPRFAMPVNLRALSLL